MITEENPAHLRAARRGDDIGAGTGRTYRFRLDRSAAHRGILDGHRQGRGKRGALRGCLAAGIFYECDHASWRIIGSGGSEGDSEQRRNPLGVRNGD
jgi:hypothetical protein